jgi:superfamily II DNA or RNA helicase/HKD family nuclease
MPNNKLLPGLYDLIQTEALASRIQYHDLEELCEWSKLSKEDVKNQLTQQIARVFSENLSELLNDKKPEEWRGSIDEWVKSLAENPDVLATLLPQEAKSLKQIKSPVEHTLQLPVSTPDTALSISALLTGASRSPALHSQLQKELSSCDRADWLVSFIKWSGLRPLLETLKKFTQTPNPDGSPRLRVATTSYMGATDIKAIEELLKLPNTEVKISYDTKRTRLHAKAYLFYRNTGFSSAYIGSANVSKAALDDGLEWTAKVSQYEIPYLWNQAVATFESHWEDQTEFSICTEENLPELQQALRKENGPKDQSISFFDLRPYDFQRVILDDIKAERQADKKKHLIIAATGTGKTIIAAFDYKAFCKGHKGQPRLLFIAHREEILLQAMSAFRQVLRDASFGELLTGRHRATQQDYLFCSVQTWNSQKLNALAKNHFDYIVLDEAHHASANSYQNIIDHIRPESLLGLTATPERSDGRDIRNDFGGAFTHELRLPEAIERALLCPFHYYGIPDAEGIDFSRMTWQAGSYAKSELNQLIEVNRVRAEWIFDQSQKYLNDLCTVRALGFCVSVKHAEYMAEFFNDAGIPSQVLSGMSLKEDRQNIQQKLVRREINFIFIVDLYNEGVDIPEVDTVLFLRPTESLTVFLQQLGRGLRLNDEKPQLTVLDFIAPQHRNFRFPRRFQSLTARPELRIDDQIEKDMPFLPTGCLMHLEKRAKEHVLQNIKDATSMLRGKQIINELRELQAQISSTPTLQEIMDRLMLDSPDDIYKRGLPHVLLEQAASRGSALPIDLQKKFAKGFRNLLLTDDHFLLDEFKQLLVGEKSEAETMSLMHTVLWGQKRDVKCVKEAHQYFDKFPGLKTDLVQMFQWRYDACTPIYRQVFVEKTGPLTLHASYTRDQILLALGKGDFAKAYPSREGVLHVAERQLDVFFVDVNKSEADFSPTTMYDDYAITDKLFHWQSQSQTSDTSPVGQRYVNHRENGYTPILFLRDKNKLANGLTSPYIFAGPLEYRKHEGSKPISFTWELEHALPARMLSWARRL